MNWDLNAPKNAHKPHLEMDNLSRLISQKFDLKASKYTHQFRPKCTNSDLINPYRKKCKEIIDLEHKSIHVF